MWHNYAFPTVNTGLYISGGTLDLAGYNQQISSLTGYGGSFITASTGSSTLTYSNGALYSYYYGSIIDAAPGGGTLGLAVAAGTLDVTSGVSNYSGGYDRLRKRSATCQFHPEFE